ncbi:MAG: hypothetical protein CW342_12100 [Thermoactinomycetaceae bacterium]|nr:hypothetical protein [Thermoactinomycetaceae bacterium]
MIRFLNGKILPSLPILSANQHYDRRLVDVDRNFCPLSGGVRHKVIGRPCFRWMVVRSCFIPFRLHSRAKRGPFVIYEYRF